MLFISKKPCIATLRNEMNLIHGIYTQTKTQMGHKTSFN